MKAILCGRQVLGVAVIFCTAGGLRCQDANPPAFEVASIRPNSDNGPQRFNLIPEFTAHNATLKDLFLLAYDVRDVQTLVAPSWMSSDRYDISTKMADTPLAGPEAMILQRRRLQRLLQERFKLAVHHETRELPVYDLTVSKGGQHDVEGSFKAGLVDDGTIEQIGKRLDEIPCCRGRCFESTLEEAA